MPNHLTHNCVRRGVGLYRDQYLLTAEVYSQIYSQPQFIYDIPLVVLPLHEERLDRGRFVNYSEYQQLYPAGYTYGNFLVEWFTERLEWISDHISGKWSFRVTPSDALNGRVQFSFEDRLEAIWFRLRF